MAGMTTNRVIGFKRLPLVLLTGPSKLGVRFGHSFGQEKLLRPDVYRDKHLDPYPAPLQKNGVKHQKEQFLRELLEAQEEISSLLDVEEKSAFLKPTVDKSMAQAKNAKDRSIEALRIYSLLRPQAPAFYKEESLLSMQSKMNEVLLSQSPAVRMNSNKDPDQPFYLPAEMDPLQFNLPVVNPRAFLLALEAATNSLSDDLHEFCELLEIVDLPAPDEPLRFKKLVDRLFSSFKLKKDPAAVDEWMFDCWPRLRPFMPRAIADLPAREVGEWLRGHITRVIANQAAQSPIRQHRGPSKEEWYDFGEDFLYDSYPVSDELVNERNTDFPIEKAGEYLTALGNFMKTSTQAPDAINEDTALQFETLLNQMKKIGLNSWLQMKLEDVETHLPMAEIPHLRATDTDMHTAKLLLKAAARGKANLLDFDALDPYQLLHGFEVQSVEEELSKMKENPFLADTEIDRLFDIKRTAQLLAIRHEPPEEIRDFIANHGRSPMEELLETEKQNMQEAGPITWEEEEDSLVSWKWKEPTNSILDAKRGMYVRVKPGLDPQLKMDRMRMTTLQFTQMNTMSASGRISYYRAIVAVGDGCGLFGTGVGFGHVPQQARNDACNRALQSLDFIDLDPGRILTTPVMGREYSTWVKIRGRAFGRGIKCNRKFLPLAYIMGLDNCYLKFGGKQKKWITRIRALRRALDGIQSRETIAHATGQKLSIVLAPGDHWMHWPDKWFETITKEYEVKYRKIKMKRERVARRSKLREVIPEELKPEWTHYSWKSPLQRWAKQQRSKAKIENNIYATESFGSTDAVQLYSSGSKSQLAAAPLKEIAT